MVNLLASFVLLSKLFEVRNLTPTNYGVNGVFGFWVKKLFKGTFEQFKHYPVSLAMSL